MSEPGDHLVRGLGLDGRVRAVATDTTAVARELRRIHQPTRTVTTALGRLATGALLLAGSLEKVTRREPVLTLEMDGGGPAGRIFATASPAGWVRAFVANPKATVAPTGDGRLDVGGVIGRDGHLSVTRDLGTGRPYRGVVPLFTGEVAKDLAWYLTESEQSPAAVVLSVSVERNGEVSAASGLLLQLLPGVSEDEARDLTERVERLGSLAETGGGPSQWLGSLFPEGFDNVETTPVEFRCGCSKDRVLSALKLIGAREVGGLLRDAERGTPAVLTCEFCRTPYEVSTGELRAVLDEIVAARLRAAVN
ncbi:MAG TPA: Hsp33 family molecular chaperone HslO [Methylomirabilota bacterium]|nr:Hsp33 family molecular chaperone HslO [Methylomirabilota bacterium]